MVVNQPFALLSIQNRSCVFISCVSREFSLSGRGSCSLQASRLTLIKPQSFYLSLGALHHLFSHIKRRPAAVHLRNGFALTFASDRPPCAIAGLELQTRRDGRIAAESFPHIHEPAPAFFESHFQLLALRRQGVEERRLEAFEGRVALDHDAVAVLQALG